MQNAPSLKVANRVMLELLSREENTGQALVSPRILNAMLILQVRAKEPQVARDTFKSVLKVAHPEDKLVAYETYLAGLVYLGRFEEATRAFYDMQTVSLLSPSKYCYMTLIEACVRWKTSIVETLHVYEQAVTCFGPLPVVTNIWILKGACKLEKSLSGEGELSWESIYEKIHQLIRTVIEPSIRGSSLEHVGLHFIIRFYSKFSNLELTETYYSRIGQIPRQPLELHDLDDKFELYRNEVSSHPLNCFQSGKHEYATHFFNYARSVSRKISQINRRSLGLEPKNNSLVKVWLTKLWSNVLLANSEGYMTTPLLNNLIGVYAEYDIPKSITYLALFDKFQISPDIETFKIYWRVLDDQLVFFQLWEYVKRKTQLTYDLESCEIALQKSVSWECPARISGILTIMFDLNYSLSPPLYTSIWEAFRSSQEIRNGLKRLK